MVSPQEFLETYGQIRENLILVLRKGILETAKHQDREVFPNWDTLMFFIDAKAELEVHFQVKSEDNADITIAGFLPLAMLFASKDDILDADTWAMPLNGGDDDQPT